MNLVDKQHVVFLEIGEKRGEVAGPLQHRARRLAQVHTHFARDDVRQCRLAQTRRTEQQHVIERFGPVARRSDEDAELFAHLRLPDVFGQ